MKAFSITAVLGLTPTKESTWSLSQKRDFMDSIYRGFPTKVLLVHGQKVMHGSQCINTLNEVLSEETEMFFCWETDSISSEAPGYPMSKVIDTLFFLRWVQGLERQEINALNELIRAFQECKIQVFEGSPSDLEVIHQRLSSGSN